MKLLLTGASSFTGTWIAEALAAAGHEVVAPLRRTIAQYDDLRQRRIARLAGKVRVIEATPFGSEPFLRLLQSEGPFAGLCHHAAEVTNYRSADFDPLAAATANTSGLPGVLAALAAKNDHCFVILTGTVFEQDEGAGDPHLQAFSPYGLSKGLTWQLFRHYCGTAGIRLGKFVIPNPFGPLEDPRFTAYLVRSWKAGQTASVKTPAYVRDNIHVDLLARAYVRFTTLRAADPAPVTRHNPSGYIGTQGAFAQRFAAEFRKRLPWECALALESQTDFAEPLQRVNLEPAAAVFPDWSEAAAWDSLVDFYR